MFPPSTRNFVSPVLVLVLSACSGSGSEDAGIERGVREQVASRIVPEEKVSARSAPPDDRSTRTLAVAPQEPAAERVAEPRRRSDRDAIRAKRSSRAERVGDPDVTVIGIEVGGVTKALPLQEVKKGGEIVNDVIGELPILATW